MTGRAFAFTSALLLAALCAQAAASCTTTTTSTANVGPNGPPTLTIISPIAGACLAVPDQSNPPPIPITIDVAGTFFLRPPGACVGLNNCGHLALYVGSGATDAGPPNNVSASAIVELQPINPPLPYGDVTLTVLLVDDLGNPWLLADNDAGVVAGGQNGPYSTQITVQLARSCGDGGAGVDAGADGGPSDGGTGDAGASDGGTSDAGAGDAGATDGGTSDAGAGDAGVTDAGSTDGGAGDAGVTDGGPTDAGTGDAGVSDAGDGDAGATDAGDGG